MKKLFVALFTLLLSAPAVFAQFNPMHGNLPGIDVLLREYYQKYSGVIQSNVNDTQYKNDVKISTKTVNGEYETVEQNDSDIYSSEIDIGVKNSAPEIKTTDSYVEVTISVPDGYCINKYLKSDYDDEDKEVKTYMPSLSDNTILLYANREDISLYANREDIPLYADREDISFKLDYEVKLTQKPVLEEGVYTTEGYVKNALTLTIKYSPKYFTFKEVFNHKPFKVAKFKYKGKNITLNTEIYQVLIITTPQGKDMEYVLEPNYQNIYNDFEFVRNGHKF